MKRKVNEACNQYYDECPTNSVCRGTLMDNNTFCYCVTGYYYDKTYDYCLAQSTYGGSCSQSSSQCLNVNLACINNYCICSGTQYWNGTYCVDYVLFSQPCTASTQCNPNDLYLTCGIPPLGKLFY